MHGLKRRIKPKPDWHISLKAGVRERERGTERERERSIYIYIYIYKNICK